MANDQVKATYAEALREVGFAESDVQRGLAMMESGRFFGFRDLCSTLSVFGSGATLQRDHVIEGIAARVERADQLAELARRGARGRLAWEAAEADRQAAQETTASAFQERSMKLSALFEAATEDELDLRVAPRQQIDDMYFELFGERLSALRVKGGR